MEANQGTNDVGTSHRQRPETPNNVHISADQDSSGAAHKVASAVKSAPVAVGAVASTGASAAQPQAQPVSDAQDEADAPSGPLDKKSLLKKTRKLVS